MSVVEDNLLEWSDLKFFKLAEGERLDLDEIPLVCKLQDRRPLVDGAMVDRVLSGMEH